MNSNNALRTGKPKDCQSCDKTDCPGRQQPQNESDDMLRQRRNIARKMCRIDRKLLVMSGKGGVGKSTVAANLAVSLALADKSVGLLDVDIHGPSIPRLMGLEGQQLVMHESEIVPIDVGGNLKVMSIGFLLGSPEDAVIWRGPMKFGVISQFLGDVEWGTLDYLVIDAPPGTGDEPLSVAQLAGERTTAVLVTTPQALSVADVRRSVSFCRKMSMPIAGIIENMSGLVCPHCNGRIDLFGSGGGEALAREMDVPVLGKIPIDPKIVECGDSGEPYIHRFAESDAAKAFAKVVERIIDGKDADDK
ncbi:MAG: Mrp/NBP35 family ATP-binding protein [Pirellulales bacterium]|nr:Mrp/NBP35 family ATP-binding protein [Pirellulales bacterium]